MVHADGPALRRDAAGHHDGVGLRPVRHIVRRDRDRPAAHLDARDDEDRLDVVQVIGTRRVPLRLAGVHANVLVARVQRAVGGVDRQVQVVHEARVATRGPRIVRPHEGDLDRLGRIPDREVVVLDVARVETVAVVVQDEVARVPLEREGVIEGEPPEALVVVRIVGLAKRVRPGAGHLARAVDRRRLDERGRRRESMAGDRRAGRVPAVHVVLADERHAAGDRRRRHARAAQLPVLCAVPVGIQSLRGPHRYAGRRDVGLDAPVLGRAAAAEVRHVLEAEAVDRRAGGDDVLRGPEEVHRPEASLSRIRRREDDEEVLVVPDEVVRVRGFLDILGLEVHGTPAVGVDERAPVQGHLPQLRDVVEVDVEAVVGQVLHLDERVEGLAVVRARRAAGTGRIAVVDVPRAVVARDAAGGVRPVVVEAIVGEVAVIRASFVVIGELPCVRSGRRVARVPEGRVLVIDPRVAEGHRLTGPMDAVVVDRGGERVRVTALHDPAREVIEDIRLDEPVDIQHAGHAGEQRKRALVDLDADAAGAAPGVLNLRAAEDRSRAHDLRHAGCLEGGNLKGNACSGARRRRGGGPAERRLRSRRRPGCGSVELRGEAGNGRRGAAGGTDALSGHACAEAGHGAAVQGVSTALALHRALRDHAVFIGEAGTQLVCGLEDAAPPNDGEGGRAVDGGSIGADDEGVVRDVLENRHAGRREHRFHRGRDGSVELNDVVELLVPGDRVVPEGSGNRRGLRKRIELEIIDRDIFHVVRDRTRHDRRRRGPRRRPQDQERREDHHEHQRDCDDAIPHAARHCVR